jgi:hypothetical protein
MSVLFNAEAGDVVYIFEGEMDCLLARSRGLNAVTCTGGAGTWRDPWSVLFVGLNVVICYDADTAGRAGAAMVARKLYGRAEKVRVVTIPLPEIQGADFTDYIVGHGHEVSDFHTLVRETPEFEPPVTDDEGQTQESEPSVRRITMTVEQILLDPEALDPPQAIAENFVWSSRVTLLAGREKSGKSTLLGAITAAVSADRPFLGMPVTGGPVLVVGPEEHPHDLARRLSEMDADLTNVHTVSPPFDFKKPIDWLTRAIAEVQPVLLVGDTLAAISRGIIKKASQSDEWTPFLGELTELAHDSGVGIILAAHMKKDVNEYRDSTAIGANVDVILEMEEGDDCLRKFERSRARWHIPPFAIRLVNNEYRLVGGEASLATRILRFIQENSGASKNRIVDGVGGNRAMTLATVDRLEAEGRIVNRGMATGTSYWLAPNEEATDAD